MKKQLVKDLLRSSFVFFLLMLPALPVFASVDLNKEDDSSGDLILTGAVAGLTDLLIIELNEDEIVKISGDGTFKFKSKFRDQQEYWVKIKKPAANHRCEIKNGQGTVSKEGTSKIDIVCQQTGKWIHPTGLDDNLSPDGQNAGSPAAALDGRGNGVVVWSQYDGKNWRIFKSEYSDGKWLNPSSLKEAISPANSNAKNPKVAVAGNGDVVVIWEQANGKIRNILMAEKRKGKWKIPQSADDYLSFKGKLAFEPDLTMDDGGNTLIVWSQASANNAHAVYKSEYRNGSWRHPASIKDIISPIGGYALSPKVAMNDKGMAIITWQQESNRLEHIFVSVYHNGAWKHPGGINDHISPASKRAGAYLPEAAVNDNGRAVIAWQQYSENRNRIYISEFDGRTWSHPKLTDAISPLTRNNDHAAINSVAVDSKGNAIILWSLQKLFNQALYKSSRQGGAWQHPADNDFIKGAKKERHFNISGKVAMSDSGKAVIAWQQRGKDKISRVFMTEFDNGVWHLPGQQLSILDYPASNVVIASSKSGTFLVVWQQRDGKFGQIYRSEFHLLKK